MFVRLIKPWNGYQPGKIFSEIPPNVAEILIQRGKAERCDEEEAAEEAQEASGSRPRASRTTRPRNP